MGLESIKLSAKELRLLLETGFILREASRFEEAEAVFRGCIELMPESEVPTVGLATVFLQNGQAEKALDTCREALIIDETSLYARLHLGEAFLFNNKPAEAREHLQSLIDSHAGSTYAATAARILAAAGIE